jgi:predicted transcriptional regulator of viral defense system
MEKVKMLYHNYLDEYLRVIRAQGRYSFTLEELKREFNLPYTTIKQSLYRQKVKTRVAQIRQGFYVIIPPEYAAFKILPAVMFIDSMMDYLGKPYYVGLLSAAALYGAAHQQPMTYFIVTQTPAPRKISNKQLKIVFFSKKTLLNAGIIKKKTQAGYINVSSPELTAFDLLENIHTFGINRITTVLQELNEEMHPSQLSKIAKLIENRANIQRLGYILENVVNNEKLADSLYKVLCKASFSPVPLSPPKGRKGQINSKWKIIINTQIESDL